MPRVRMKGRSVQPPGLSTPSPIVTLCLDIVKKRSHNLKQVTSDDVVMPVLAYNAPKSATSNDSQDVNIVKTDDTSATTVSESNLLDKTREGSFDLPVRAQGEINLTGFDITKFYGDFALSKRKYIGQVDERRTRNYPSRFQALSMSEVIAYEYKYSKQQGNFQPMSAQGTAHSDIEDSNILVTWEAYQAEKERHERETKQLEYARIARENELLFLGHSSCGVVKESHNDVESERALLPDETDLLEFSPVIAPISAPAASTFESQESKAFILSPGHLQEETELQHIDTAKTPKPAYLLHIPTNLTSSTNVSTPNPSKPSFGGMVIQGLRDYRPLVKASSTQRQDLNSQARAPPTIQKPASQVESDSASDSDDLIEL